MEGLNQTTSVAYQVAEQMEAYFQLTATANHGMDSPRTVPLIYLPYLPFRKYIKEYKDLEASKTRSKGVPSILGLEGRGVGKSLKLSSADNHWNYHSEIFLSGSGFLGRGSRHG
jgi:hypothetical protein